MGKVNMEVLKNKKEIFIRPKAPYNFDATVFKPTHYPSPLEVYEKGKYWFAMRLNKKIYGVKMEDTGTINNPKVKVTIFSKTPLSEKERKEIIDEMNFRFEFNRDIFGFYKKFKKDEVLAPFLKKWQGMRDSCANDLYGLLMIGIFLQNTVIKRTVQMTKDMLEKYGEKVYFDGKELYEFWTPEKMAKVPEDESRALKVGYRAKLFIRLSESFVEENINETELRKLPVEAAKKRLIKLYGVGPETARILLVEALHHYDIFEHIAPWQQKIYSKLLFNKKLVLTERIIKYIKTKWGEWANLAVSYIWEDIFWQRRNGAKIDWLEKEIRM